MGLRFVLRSESKTVPDQAELSQPEQDSRSAMNQSAAQPVRTPQAAPQPEPISRSQANFSSPWDKFLAKAPAEPKVIITYSELGYDLTGQGDPARGNLMRTLLAHFNWPKGTPVFWPCTLPAGNSLEPQHAMFWQGANLLACPNIICFGAEALGIICPEADPALSTFVMGYSTVTILPAVSDLMGKLPHELHLSVASASNIRI